MSRRDHVYIGPNAQSSISIHSGKGGEHNEPGFVFLRGESDRTPERSEREENRTRESGEGEPRKTITADTSILCPRASPQRS